MKRSLGHGVAALAIALSWATACADVLGINGTFEGVTAEFCKCDVLDSHWPRDAEGTEFFTCKEYESAALGTGSPEAKAWIESFVERGCGDCENALDCAQEPPLCIAEGAGPCDTDASCCGYDKKVPTAGYCGYVPNEAGDALDRACVADPDPLGCAVDGEACSDVADCCGSAGALAVCPAQVGFCLARCDPENQTLCPGCCAYVDFGEESEPVTACVGGLPYDPDSEGVACETTCFASCPLGLGCGPVEHRLEFLDVNGDPRFTIITVTQCIALTQDNGE